MSPVILERARKKIYHSLVRSKADLMILANLHQEGPMRTKLLGIAGKLQENIDSLKGD